MSGWTWRRRALLAVVVSAVLMVTGVVLVMVNTHPGAVPDQGTPGDRAVGVTQASLQAQGNPTSVVVQFHEGQVAADSAEADAPMRIGSISKVITATMAVRLVDRGQLDLDTPVVELVPWLRTADGRQDEITVRHLLNQTSGLPTWAGQVDLTEPETTVVDRVRQLAEVSLDSEPGTTFHYSNKNFALLHLVIEAATGTSYGDVLRTEVVEPLGLTETTADPGTVSGEVDLDRGEIPLFGAHLPYRVPHFPGAVADGYLVSTASDLAVLFDAVASDQGRGTSFLSERTRTAMLTPPADVAPDPYYGTTYGLGIRISPDGAVWHEGELSNVQADVGIVPTSRDGLIVITQHHGHLFAGDAPFLAGMAALVGDRAEVDDGGYRSVALWMVAVAALTLGLIAADLTRWRTLRSRGPARRLLASTVPRLALAAALTVGTFLGVGAMLGLPGPAPFGLVWSAAPDLTAIVLGSSLYLVVSAVAVLPRSG